jgi:predicted small secreted protein
MLIFWGNTRMKNLIRNSIILTALTVILIGCNTMRGLGEDIENAGGAIEEAADRND